MKRKLFRAFLLLLALAGIGLILYPNLRRLWADRQSGAVIREVQAKRTENLLAEDAQQRPYETLYRDMQTYNAEIYRNRQSGLQDAWSYEQPPFSLAEYGVVEEAVGYLTIEAMDLHLPLYLGASRNNLAKGAAVLGNTSMPIGGENTNCVIAGHRGWQGIPMFLDIQDLQPGDTVVLDNLWETLTYTVTEIRIIRPDEIDAVKIQGGRDLLTLVTCHPYPHNTQRYLVYCERVPDTTEATAPAGPGPAPTAAVSPPGSRVEPIEAERLINRAALVGLGVLALAVLLLVLRRKRSRRK